MFKDYYQLAKPGIIYGNALATVGGFLLAARGHFNPWLFAATLLGISLIIGSACVLNNYIDRDIDILMARTKRRALVSGKISGRNALIYAAVLGTLGTAVLGIYTNLLTLIIALIGMLFYVVIYGYAKRHSVRGTEIGSISGAVPPVVGYVAVTGQVDGGAWLLFAILVIWQMPHFYAIAMYRLDDYAAAAIPVLPVKVGLRVTKFYIIAYVAAFALVVPLLTILGYTGITFLVVMSLVAIAWFILGLRQWRSPDYAAWARRMFHFSLSVLVVLCVMWSVDVLLP
jgi:protoheme IX farnesyltransferase